MRFSKPIRTNVAYNATLRRRPETYDVVALVAYESPLPMATGGTTDGTTTTGGGGGSSVGGTGDWAFTETIESDGVSLLNVNYKAQQVHTFLAK